jgi:hypothetical protein
MPAESAPSQNPGEKMSSPQKISARCAQAGKNKKF